MVSSRERREVDDSMYRVRGVRTVKGVVCF